MDIQSQSTQIPDELTRRQQWVCWDYRDGRKMPLNARTGLPAKSNDPSTWTDFTSASEAADRLNLTGIGYVFTADDGLVGIDLDECLDDAGQLADWAAEILDRFDSYSEVSPSGRGLKIWCMGAIGKGRKRIVEKRDGAKASGIEVYSTGRYFTVTGERWKDSDNEVRSRQDQIDWLWSKYWPETDAKRQKATVPQTTQQHYNRSDRDDRDRAAKYLAKMRPAVSGQGGHVQTLLAAEHLVRGFGLSDDDAFELLSDWNQTCDPPWRESELRHKLSEARTKGTAVEFGQHLRNDGASHQVVSASGVNLDWTEPLELPTKLGTVDAFPIELLPVTFQSWIEDIAERLQCPPDFPAVAIMITVAGIVGRKVGIRPQRKTDWLVVPNLWGAVIGRPGIMKTPAMQEPLRILKRFEIEAKAKHDGELLTFKQDEFVAKAAKKLKEEQLKAALKKGGSVDVIARELAELDPSEPARKRYLVNDSTVEKIGEILCQNPNGVMLFRDELTGLLKALDKQGQECARAFFLESWNGDGRYTFDRIGRGTIDIPAAILSIMGGIQPGPLADYLKSAVAGGAGDDGLLQRFQLAVWPDCKLEWRNVDRFPNSDAKQLAFETCERLDNLNAVELAAESGPFDDVPHLRFDDEAQKCFDAWRADLEPRLRSGHEHPAIESHLAKYRSLIPSLALLTHLCEEEDGGPVTLAAIERAVLWARYLESHARRIYGSVAHRSNGAAQALAAKIQGGSLPDGFALRDVYRHGWSGLATREDAQGAVDLMIDCKWIRPEEVAAGTRTRTVFRINPMAIRNN
jgi:hypothetical protein